MTISNNRITRFVRKKFFRRKYKDFLFRRVFRDAKDVLSLYNAVNGTNYNDPADLEITTLEDAIYMSMKNDVSFIVASTLNLYEHQSTYNPNMPLRGLFYFSKLYEAYVKLHDLDIYSSSRIELPKPQFVVFYNGSNNVPDEQKFKLSDLYKNSDISKEPSLECIARVININYGHSKEILESCKRLNDYAYFVGEVNNNISLGMKTENAVNNAIDECIEKGILSDILLKHKAEVFDMLLFTYDEKLHRKNEKRLAREEGRAEEKLNTEREKKRADAAEAKLKEKDEIIARLRAEINKK